MLTDVCSDNVECLFDFDQTGDAEVGMAAMAFENETATEIQKACKYNSCKYRCMYIKFMLNYIVSFPPNITAPETFMATVGEESVYTFTVSSDSQNINVIILHEGEETLPSGVQLNNPDGDSYTITWTPADNTSVLNLTIVAMDPNLEKISSFHNPVVQLCACENEGNCTTNGLLANDFSFIILNCECPEGTYVHTYIAKYVHKKGYRNQKPYSSDFKSVGKLLATYALPSVFYTNRILACY